MHLPDFDLFCTLSDGKAFFYDREFKEKQIEYLGGNGKTERYNELKKKFKMDENLLTAHPINHYEKRLHTAYLFGGDRLIYAKCSFSTYYFIDIVEKHAYEKFERSFKFSQKDHDNLDELLMCALPAALKTCSPR